MGEGVTIGLDLGDKKHSVCVLDGRGEIVAQRKLPNQREALRELIGEFPEATVAMEAGMHSPWISRLFKELGCEVIVANPRKVRAISQNERKSDERDAEMLARLARVDTSLLHPIEHGSEEAQQHLLSLKLRDSLVRTRVNLISSIRFTLKSLGYDIKNTSSASFHKQVMKEVPASCLGAISPLLAVLGNIAVQVKELEDNIARLIRERYPQAQRLQQIEGVGPITSLYFVLKVGDPSRFNNVREIGAYLGLCPRRDQSGGTDKQLRISKCGDTYLRCLLVNAAQYLLGPFGPPCALKDYGVRLQGGGTAREKKRAVVAVARKLAVLMMSLWKNGSEYERHPAPPPPNQ